MKENSSWFEKFGKVISVAANSVMMNVLFLVACLPVVTIGAAWNALFSAIRYNVRGDKWLTGFKVGFKTRFWRSTVSWLAMLVMIGITFIDLSAYAAVEAYTAETIVRLVVSGIMLLLMTGLNAALILLNVYIPTRIGDWIRNAVNMIFQAPLQLALTGALMWLPVLLAFFAMKYFYYFIMVFIVAYYILIAFCITMLLKQTLLDCLLEARAQGTLLREEGKQKQEEEDSEERSDNNE